MKVGRKIRTVLIIPFVVIILISVGLTGIFSYYNGEKAVNEIAVQLSGEIASRIIDHLRIFLSTPHLINKYNDGLIHNGFLDVNNQAEMEIFFLDQIKSFTTVTSIYYGNNQGGLVDAGREGANGSLFFISTDDFKMGTFQKHSVDDNGNRQELLLTVPNFDARTRSWYEVAKMYKQPSWSDIYILFSGQDMAIAASRPVYLDEELSGVLSIDIFLSQFSNFLKSLEIGKNGQTFIVEKSGLLVASSVDEKPFRIFDQEQRRIYAKESTNLLIRSGADYVNKELDGFRFIDKIEEVKFHIENEKYFLRLTPFQDEYGIDWIIAIVIPENDFLGPIKDGNIVTFSLILISLFLAILFGILILRWVTRPILEMNEAAKSLTKGNWETSISAQREDEIGQLGKSFVKMVSQLKNNMNKLEKEIVSKKNAENELKVLNKKIQKEKDFIDEIINAQTDTFFVFNPKNGEALKWNDHFSKISGYSNKEIKQMKAPQSYYGKNDLKNAGKAMKRLYSVGVATTELSLITKSGKQIPFEYKISLGKGKSNEPIIISVGRDVSERNKILRLLKISKQNLEDKVKARTDDLQKAYVELKSLDIKKDQFISIAAHELKTPLTSIRGFSQFLQDPSVLKNKTKAKRYLELINKNTDRLYNLVIDLIDSTRISLGKLSLKIKVVKIETIVKEIEENFSPVAMEKGLKLTFKSEKGLKVKADSARLLQIIRNLVMNAINYTDEGEINLRISQIKNNIKFEVSDTGVGISKEKFSIIFDRFYQVGDKYRKEIKGSGLGLSISKGLVELMKGHIGVRSEERKGSTFYFTLPKGK